MYPSVREYSPWLDVIRGIAISAVVVTHTAQTSDAFTLDHGGKLNKFFTRFASNGAWGVELFFFLSGWLLASIYQTKGRPLGKQYLYKRLARIFPLWTVFLLIGVARNYLNLKGPYYSLAHSHSIPHNQIFNELFISVFSALTFTLWFSGVLWGGVIPGGWSIQAEVGHYLIFPLIRNRSINKVLIFLSFINIATLLLKFLEDRSLIRIKALNLAVNAWLRLDLYATFGYFMIGVISCNFARINRGKRNPIRAFQALGINPFNLSLYLIVWLLLPITFAHHGEIGTLAWVIFLLYLSRLFFKINILRKIFQILGRFSYFIYFCHFLILEIGSSILENFHINLNFVGSFGVSFLCYFIFTIGVSCLLAIPSEKYFEKPIMKFARMA